MIRAPAGVCVTSCHFNVCVFSQFREIRAQRGLQFLVIESVLDPRKHVFHRRNACHLMVVDLEDGVSLLDADNVCDLPRLHGEGSVFKFLSELATLEGSKCPPIGGRGAVRILFRDFSELRAGTELFQDVLGLGLCRAQSGSVGLLLCGFFRRRLSGPRSTRVWGCRRCCGLRSNENLAQLDVLRMAHLLLVFVIELLLFVFTGGEMARNFFTNDLLRDKAIFCCLLEVLPGNALLLSFFLQSLH